MVCILNRPNQRKTIRRICRIITVTSLIAYCLLMLGFASIRLFFVQPHQVPLLAKAIPAIAYGSLFFCLLTIVAWFVLAYLPDDAGGEQPVRHVEQRCILHWYKQAILCAQCSGVLLMFASIALRFDALLLGGILLLAMGWIVIRYLRSEDRKLVRQALTKLCRTWCSISIHGTFLFALTLTALCAQIVTEPQPLSLLLTHPFMFSTIFFAVLSFTSQASLPRYLVQKPLR